jgi:hypothetical protein
VRAGDRGEHGAHEHERESVAGMKFAASLTRSLQAEMQSELGAIERG